MENTSSKKRIITLNDVLSEELDLDVAVDEESMKEILRLVKSLQENSKNIKCLAVVVLTNNRELTADYAGQIGSVSAAGLLGYGVRLIQEGDGL